MGKNWPRKKLGWSTYAFEVVICYHTVVIIQHYACIPATPHHRPTGHHHDLIGASVSPSWDNLDPSEVGKVRDPNWARHLLDSYRSRVVDPKVHRAYHV